MKWAYACGRHILRVFREGGSVAAATLPVIEVESWAEAERKGWTVTTDIRWSLNGKPVFLCPECSGLVPERDH